MPRRDNSVKTTFFSYVNSDIFYDSATFLHSHHHHVSKYVLRQQENDHLWETNPVQD